MKVCQAFMQLGHEVILLVPGPQPEGLTPGILREHYGLSRIFNIEWLLIRSRRQFPWAAIQKARQMDAGLLYTWHLQAAVFGLIFRLPAMVELHDFPSEWLGRAWYQFWLFLFLTIPGRKRIIPITLALQRALHLPYQKVVVAPDGVDLERYNSLPEAEIARQELGLPALPTVMCTGHLYQGRGVDLFVTLAKEFSKVDFVWVGGRSDDVEAWKSQASLWGISNLIFTGFVPNKQIPLYQAAADILLMPYERVIATSSGGNTAQVCSPMKMFEYMAAGRAIISSDLPVLHEILDETMAIFCQPEDTHAWENALSSLLDDPNKRQVLGQCAQEAVQRYSWLERARNVLIGYEF
jgi:glycosyltransferase involved in cell wall biosynthesis